MNILFIYLYVHQQDEFYYDLTFRDSKIMIRHIIDINFLINKLICFIHSLFYRKECIN